MNRRTTRRGFLLTFGAAVSVLTGTGAEADSTAEGPDTASLKRVRVAAVVSTRASRELRFAGTTRAARRARLAFSLGGRLLARPVEVGDRVRQGQMLARLDDLEVENAQASARAALAELEARRAQSERDRERAKRLAEARAATAEELERTAAAVAALRAAEDSARAQLDEARRRLDETRLTAPFAGTVTEVFFEPGEYARTGSPVVAVAGDGGIEIEVEVPESVVPRIAVGDAVEVRLPMLGEASVAGRIESVGRTAAGPGRLFPVVAAVDSGGLIAGATAELVLKLESGGALAVPIEAVVNPGGRRPAVFRVTGGEGTAVVEKIAIEVGKLLADAPVRDAPVRDAPIRVIVHGELEAGDLVVIGGQRGLLDGERVEVLP